VEAQLSHVDPSKVSAAYNHAAYVEPRRQMMQDWANRLDLLEQGYGEQALVPLQIHAGSAVAAFAKLAGRSRDQIHREIKTGQMLAVSFGNRGRRIPDWQLDLVRRQLVQSVRQRAPALDAWNVYWALLQPCECLDGRAAADDVTGEDHQSVEDEVVRSLSSKK